MPGLETGPRGGIRVNAHLQTSDPDIYAVGDAIEASDFVTGEPTQVPLAGPANRQGRIAADNIFGRPIALSRDARHGDRARVRSHGGADRCIGKNAAARWSAVSQGLRPSGQPRRLLSRRRRNDAQGDLRSVLGQSARRASRRRRGRRQTDRRAVRRDSSRHDRFRLGGNGAGLLAAISARRKTRSTWPALSRPG